MNTHTIAPATFTLLRLERGYSRDDLAHMLDVHPHRIPRWERGKEPVPPGIVARMAAIDACAAEAAAAVIADRADAAGATIDAHRENGQPGPAPITHAPLVLGPFDDTAFWRTWPEYEPMPARWWWHVARIVERYGIPIQRGTEYSR